MKKIMLPIVGLLLAAVAIAGNQLPGNTTWTGTNSNGALSVTVKSNADGTYVIVTRTYTSPDGVKTISSMGCALNSAGTAYGTPQGGEIEFDDVVNGDSYAYTYELRYSNGSVQDTGLVSQ